eukprot:scaffold1172_cov115-Cylindrotheca_fusiformis.AAC.3
MLHIGCIALSDAVTIDVGKRLHWRNNTLSSFESDMRECHMISTTPHARPARGAESMESTRPGN